MIFPKVVCQVVVSGGSDPTDQHRSMFIIALKPKFLVFPKNEFGQVFNMGNVADSVKDLREYLAGGFDRFLGEQAWMYFDEEELDKFVRVLPEPFNDPDVQAELTWTEEDIVFDKAAALLLDFYDSVFSELELQRLKVGVLRIILAVKDHSLLCSKKADLIEAILQDQKSKGLSAVRVKQQGLEVFA